MSEKKETIEESKGNWKPYKSIEDVIAELQEVTNVPYDCPHAARATRALAVIDDLMVLREIDGASIRELEAEREKMKERIGELTETIRERERYISTITS